MEASAAIGTTLRTTQYSPCRWSAASVAGTSRAGMKFGHSGARYWGHTCWAGRIVRWQTGVARA